MPHVLANALDPVLRQKVKPPLRVLLLPPRLGRTAPVHRLVPVLVLRARGRGLHVRERAALDPVRDEQLPERLCLFKSYRGGCETRSDAV